MNFHLLSIAIVKVNKSLSMLQVFYYWYSVIGTVKTGLLEVSSWWLSMDTIGFSYNSGIAAYYFNPLIKLNGIEDCTIEQAVLWY